MKAVRQNGFTLVEVLVAVSVTALVLSAVYGIFTAVGGARERVESDGRAYHLARVLCDRLAREIRGTYWHRDHPDAVFAGEADEAGNTVLDLTTTAASPLGRSAGGIARIGYSLDEDRVEGDRRWRLRRREAPLFAPDFESLQGQRMSEQVEGFTLRFYDGSRWRDEWNAARRGRLPHLVEIRLEIVAGRQRLPFVTVVDVPLSGVGR